MEAAYGWATHCTQFRTARLLGRCPVHHPSRTSSCHAYDGAKAVPHEGVPRQYELSLTRGTPPAQPPAGPAP